MDDLKRYFHKKARDLTCILISSMLILMIVVIHNETVKGDQTIITEDTTWTLANSPYIITGNVLVEHGVSLTIEPGVEVKFDGLYYMQIEGKLVAKGTENNRITFTSNKDSPADGNWKSIKLMSNAENGSVLSYCNIEYGAHALYIDVLDIAAPNITHCNVNNNSQTGITYNIRPSTLHLFNVYNEISNNTITDSAWGIIIHYEVKIPNANLLVHHNLIENNLYGIRFHVLAGNLTVSHNTIIRNDGSGVGCRYNRDPVNENVINIAILNNLILYNGGNGIYLEGSRTSGTRFNSTIIEHNTILYNGDGDEQNEGGIYFEQRKQDAIVFQYNNIYNNTPYDAVNAKEFDIDISNNWWGSTKLEIIEQKLHDYYDDFNIGNLNYTPFLTQPNPDAPDASPYIDQTSDIPTPPIDINDNDDISIIMLYIVIIIVVIALIVIYIFKRK